MLSPVHAQETLPPFLKMAPYETEKLGEGLYSFRWGAYRNIFLVTDEGVIATDPMGVESAAVFRKEIAKITDQPVKYVVYSQSYWDHVTGATTSWATAMRSLASGAVFGRRSEQVKVMSRGTEWYILRTGRIREVRAYFAANALADSELADFPYADRAYLTRLPEHAR